MTDILALKVDYDEWSVGHSKIHVWPVMDLISFPSVLYYFVVLRFIIYHFSEESYCDGIMIARNLSSKLTTKSKEIWHSHHHTVQRHEHSFDYLANDSEYITRTSR